MRKLNRILEPCLPKSNPLFNESKTALIAGIAYVAQPGYFDGIYIDSYRSRPATNISIPGKVFIGALIYLLSPSVKNLHLHQLHPIQVSISGEKVIIAIVVRREHIGHIQGIVGHHCHFQFTFALTFIAINKSRSAYCIGNAIVSIDDRRIAIAA